MNNHISSDVLDAVHSIFYQEYSIRRPKIVGSQDNVFIIGKDPENSFVFKFGHPDLVQKSEIISKIYRINGIPVPETTAYEYNGNWFEMSRYVPGKTLYEYVGTGMSAEKIRTAYLDIIDTFIKMSQINISALPSIKLKYTYQVARENIKRVNNSTLAGMFQLAVRALNAGQDKDTGLYHCGLTPKNIILSPDGKISGIVDLEEVALSNKNYAFGMMAAKYQQLGYKIDELINYYEDTSGQQLNHNRIGIITNITNLGKHLLWKNANNKSNTR